MKIKALIFAAGLLVFAIAACDTAKPTANVANTATNVNKPSVTPATPEIAQAKSGKDLYTINCMTCHKDSGKGGKVTVDGKTMEPDDITTDKMKAKSDEKLYSYIADGIVDEGMPAFKDKLTVDEMKAIVQHVRDLQK